jgi:hypothetical protein
MSALHHPLQGVDVGVDHLAGLLVGRADEVRTSSSMEAATSSE